MRAVSNRITIAEPHEKKIDMTRLHQPCDADPIHHKRGVRTPWGSNRPYAGGRILNGTQ